MKKRVLSTLMIIIMVAALIPTAAFAADFADVAPNAWYASDVNKAVEMGLVNGKTGKAYCPDDNLTYAEAVKLAACMNQKNATGTVGLQNGIPWYQSYVDYCKENGIIAKDYNWMQNATRADYMEIFAKALPDTELTAINTVEDGSIPDVSAKHPQAAAIYKLYRAGIVQGMDDKFSCNPNSNIKRSEVAAILVRMMDKEARKSFSMAGAANKSLTIKEQPKNVNCKVGDTINFSVTVEGGKAPYKYQWQCLYDGQWDNTDDGTESIFTRKVSLMDFNYLYQYRCIITDANGQKVTSEAAKPVETVEPLTATLTVNSASSVTVKKDNVITLDCVASGGTAPYMYQWYLAGPDGDYYDLGKTLDIKSDASTITVLADSQYSVQTVKCRVIDYRNKETYSNEITINVTDI